MKDENAFSGQDKESLKLIIGNKLKEFFQSHDIDKMTQKYSDDLRTLSILYHKTKQLLQQNQIILDISQHQCRKCQLRMLEEMNQNRSKTPTKQFPFIKQDNSHAHNHNHSLINMRLPNRSMTPELNITGSHIGVVPANKLKAKGTATAAKISLSKKQKEKNSFTPDRSKSPSDLTSMKMKKNIIKSPTAVTPKANKRTKITIQANANKGKLTASKTDRNVTPKHKRVMTSLSREKEKLKETQKDSRFNRSVSGKKVKENNAKKQPTTISGNAMKGSKPAISPTIKRNIKNPVVGKNKAKDNAKSSPYSPDVSYDNNQSNGIKGQEKEDKDVQTSLNEIKKTVKGLKESLKIIDYSDDEIVLKAEIRSKQIRKVKNDYSNHIDNNDNDNDSNDESIRLEKLQLKREKEKRIMDKLRSEKTKAINREPSPDFNTKNIGYTIHSDDLQIGGLNQKSNASIEKKELYKSTNYEISTNQKNEYFGISSGNTQSLNMKKELRTEKGDEYSYKNKAKEVSTISNKGGIDKEIETLKELNSNTITTTDYYKKKTLVENTALIDKEKEKNRKKDKKNDNENENESESKLMKEKREIIREKVMEKRKEKEKSKEKIVKEKNVISPSLNTHNNYINTNDNDTITHYNIISDSGKQHTVLKNSREQKDKTKGEFSNTNKDHSLIQTNKISPISDNKLLKLLILTLNSGYVNISKKTSVTISSPQLLPAFQLKHLLVEKIAVLMKQSSKIKAFLSKYVSPFSNMT